MRRGCEPRLSESSRHPPSRPRRCSSLPTLLHARAGCNDSADKPESGTADTHRCSSEECRSTPRTGGCRQAISTRCVRTRGSLSGWPGPVRPNSRGSCVPWVGGHRGLGAWHRGRRAGSHGRPGAAPPKGYTSTSSKARHTRSRIVHHIGRLVGSEEGYVVSMSLLNVVTYVGWLRLTDVVTPRL
jgi:hypothetical protein